MREFSASRCNGDSDDTHGYHEHDIIGHLFVIVILDRRASTWFSLVHKSNAYMTCRHANKQVSGGTRLDSGKNHRNQFHVHTPLECALVERTVRNFTTPVNTLMHVLCVQQRQQ